MTPEEFKAAMIDLFGEYPEGECYDEEDAHYEADVLMINLLAELGYGDGVELFKRASKWYA
jgi:hypothetical protein